MKNSADLRNFVVAGHAGSGKTTLCDLMLFKAKAADRLPNVDGKSSISDYTTEEQQRGSSIYATIMNCQWQDKHFFFMDTPGYAEFVGETLSAMRAADSVLVVLDGVDGPQVGTARAWKFTRERGIPRFALINRLDRERADFKRVLEQMRKNHGRNVVLPLTYPVGSESEFTRVIDVLHCKDIPPEIADEVAENREMLMDAIAETNDTIMERYLNGETLDETEVAAGLMAAVLSTRIIPVFAGSAAKDIGISEFMDYVCRIFPNPLDKITAPMADGGKYPVKDDGDGVALIFKAVNDPFVGQLAFIKVISGQLKGDCELYNLNNNTKERISSFMLMNGKNSTPCSELGPGELAAVAKLKTSHIGDTLCTTENGPVIKGINFPEPVMSYAVTAKQPGEDEKITTALSRIADSDPTCALVRDPETHEFLLKGMGEQHIATVLKKLHDNYKLDINLTPPRIPYRETITAQGMGQYRHKKQTGGAGQFAEVQLRIEPSGGGFIFNNAVVGGNIPKNFIPAVEKGVSEMMSRGPLVGCPVENVKVEVFDGTYHPVDSNEMAFKIASRAAFKDAMQKAKPIVLEPIMRVKISIPDNYMGDVSGDLNHKRGHIMGVDNEEGMQVLSVEVPLAEMHKYATELRSITHGRGSFEMTFGHYEPVPTQLAANIIADYQARSRSEED